MNTATSARVSTWVQRLTGLAVAVTLVASAVPTATAKPSVPELVKAAKNPTYIRDRLARYPRVSIGIDGKRITPDVQAMLSHIRKAVDHIDRVYWDQISPDGHGQLSTLATSDATAAVHLADLMRIHYGVWDRHSNDVPFIGQDPRPRGANFYPTDLSRQGFEDYVTKHPSRAPGLWSPYSVVRRKGKDLVATPYSKAYAKDLTTASKALEAAAAAYKCSPAANTPEGQIACPCADLAKFLKSRAKSLMTDEYRESEMLWVGSALCPLDVAIGPYEFYEDRLLGLKTAFMGIVSLRDDKESGRFIQLQQHGDGLFKNLPLTSSTKGRFLRTKASPITVADALYTGGDARSGYQVRAYLLPNDEIVRETRGTKNVILRNVVKAKFDTVTKVVARRLFTTKWFKKLSFRAYFDILLTWQLAHSVVPGKIVLPNKSTTTAQQQLRQRHTIINLVKGESVALVNWFYLLDKGVVKGNPAEMAVTYLAQLFDSARMTGTSPQSVAKIIIYNYLAQKWVVRYNGQSQTFELNPPALRAAVRSLASETLEILARGDYDGAGRMLVEYGIMPAELRAKMAQLSDVPLDIWPRYTSMPK